MSDPQARTPLYHVLLIGIAAYPEGVRQLLGPVHDIDAIEDLLLGRPGIGMPAEQIKVTRLASARLGSPTTTRFKQQTLEPTRANIIQALRTLGSEAVGPQDRALIFFAGHGHELPWEGTSIKHEALVPSDVKFIYDVELNALIAKITERTEDVTIILDCCNSAGVYRDLAGNLSGEDKIVARALEGDSRATLPNLKVGSPPDPAILALASRTPDERPGLFRDNSPRYVCIYASQSVEKAGEQDLDIVRGGTRLTQRRGILTYGLEQAITSREKAADRAALRWADIWSNLLDGVTRLNAAQHAGLSGRWERKIFGGDLVKRDVGYRVRAARTGEGLAGQYIIEAGSLLGLTEKARVAVYGPTPNEFPALNSDADKQARIGLLEVTRATRLTATARAVGTVRMVEGARARLVEPGVSARLQVRLEPYTEALATRLGQSTVLNIVPAGSQADVVVQGPPRGPWLIGDSLVQDIATVPREEYDALKAGLEHYANVVTVLRLGQVNDPELTGRLQTRLLDCATWQGGATEAETNDPKLPEARLDGGVYQFDNGDQMCMLIKNTYTFPLYVSVLCVEAFGFVSYLGEATVRPGEQQTIWGREQIGTPFQLAVSQPMPNGTRTSSLDRIVVVGTTKPGVSLQGLALDKTVQQVVEANVSFRGEVTDRGVVTQTQPPPELWTGQTLVMKIGSAGR